MDEEKQYYIAFSVFPGIGPVRFRLLLHHFKCAKSAWNASAGDLRSVGLGELLTSKFEQFRRTFDIHAYIQEMKRKHITAIAVYEKKYPLLLKQISDAPFVLYVKGTKVPGVWNIDRSIGVVGTRKMTNYGKAAVHRIVRGLVEHGYTIVSGMAYGVDAQAHYCALSCSGKTIAVLGCGVDIIAPASNTVLYQRIVQGNGAVVSEMPLSLQPNKGIFTARNRIISGLSLGVVVIEGTDKSGSLITARYALDQGREVFAVPGPITSQYSKASAILLKQGAVFVEQAEDIVEQLDGQCDRSQISVAWKETRQSNCTPEEQRIISCIESSPIHIDEIIRKTQMKASDVMSIITLLEMRKIIYDTGGNVYDMKDT